MTLQGLIFLWLAGKGSCKECMESQCSWLEHYDFGEYIVSLEDDSNLTEELNLLYGIRILQDLNRRTQLAVSFGYNSVLNSPFGEEGSLSTIFNEFQSIQELDDQLWNDRFSSKMSIIYFL